MDWQPQAAGLAGDALHQARGPDPTVQSPQTHTFMSSPHLFSRVVNGNLHNTYTTVGTAFGNYCIIQDPAVLHSAVILNLPDVTKWESIYTWFTQNSVNFAQHTSMPEQWMECDDTFNSANLHTVPPELLLTTNDQYQTQPLTGNVNANNHMLYAHAITYAMLSEPLPGVEGTFYTAYLGNFLYFSSGAFTATARCLPGANFSHASASPL